MCSLSFGGCNPKSASDTGDSAPAEPTREQTIYVSDADRIAEDCAAVRSESFVVSEADVSDLPSAAVRRVLRDVHPSPGVHREETKPIMDYFNSVRVEQGTAVISFAEGALEYFNAPACAQAAVSAPIVKTMLEFEDIEEIAWEFGGRIITEFDA